MRFQILTIFPELFEKFSQVGLVGRACSEGRIAIETTHLRNYAINTQGQIDDTPYGGGSGMVLRPEAAVQAIEEAKAKSPKAKVVLFSPRGQVFRQPMAKQLVRESVQNEQDFIFLCCRYEGVDQRVIDHFVDLEISLGDYILMGGEVAAMSVIEALSRLVPGVLGNPESIERESFEDSLLEHAQYTKPSEFRGWKVPDVLLSGHHQEIEKYRREDALHTTLARRPDLVTKGRLPKAEVNVALIHYPVLDKNGKVIVSSITNLDLPDIARSAHTYGVNKFYIVHPTKTLRRLSEKICEHWDTGYGSTYNPNRKEALSTIAILPDLDDVLRDIEVRTGALPQIITTSARDSERMLGFSEIREKLYSTPGPYLILFGTGWGLTDELLNRAEFHLAPVKGYTDYNHLSVRAAAAIIFDRLLGAH